MEVEVPREKDEESGDSEIVNEAEESMRSLETLLLMVAIANKEGGAKKTESDEFVSKNVPDWAQIDGKRIFERRRFMCAQCEKGSTIVLRRCSSCHLFHYCSPECQKKHWGAHKSQCSEYSQGLKDVPTMDIMTQFYRYFSVGLISIPEFLYLQAEHMLLVAEKIRKACGPGNAKVGLSASWMESAIEFEGNYTHPIFFVTWIDSEFEPHPETYFRLWLVAEKSDKERDRMGRELVFQMVKLLEGFGIETLAVSTGQGFEKQGTFPVAEVALVRSELIEEVDEGTKEAADDKMDTS